MDKMNVLICSSPTSANSYFKASDSHSQVSFVQSITSNIPIQTNLKNSKRLKAFVHDFFSWTLVFRSLDSSFNTWIYVCCYSIASNEDCVDKADSAKYIIGHLVSWRVIGRLCYLHGPSRSVHLLQLLAYIPRSSCLLVYAMLQPPSSV